jgi:hypothetical protein
MKQRYLPNAYFLDIRLPYPWMFVILFFLLTGQLSVHGQSTCTSPTFIPGAKYPYDNGVSNLKVAEVTGDQHPDLLYFGSGRLVVMPGGANGLTSALSYSTGGTENMGISVGDLNNDGRMDVVIANHRNTIGVLLGLEGGGFTTALMWVP